MRRSNGNNLFCVHALGALRVAREHQHGVSLIGFEGGDRRRPIATVWESAALTELRIVSKTKVVVDCPDVSIGDESGAPIARVGDPIDIVFDVSAVSTALASGTGILVAVGVISAGATKVKAS